MNILPLIGAFVLCLGSGSAAAQSEVHATYYHKKFYGRLTSTGETLDSTLFTAANRDYNWGTILEVTNQMNGRTVQVKVNDCGPHAPGNVVDLTQAAATQLDMVKTGRVPVGIRVVRPSNAGPTCKRGAWAKRLRAQGKAIPPPPPDWVPTETQGALPPAVIQDVNSDVTTLPATPRPPANTAPRTAPAAPAPSSATPEPSIPRQRTQGMVGFYLHTKKGTLTATGETYANRGLTAASREYPYNTVLRLTNPLTGENTRVRVNDCGPGRTDHQLKISRAAAKQLGILVSGPANVNIEVVKMGHGGPVCKTVGTAPPPAPAVYGPSTAAPAPDSPAPQQDTGPTDSQPAAAPIAAGQEPEFDPDAMLFGVKMGSYKNSEGAKELARELKGQGLSPVYIIQGKTYARVYTGRYYFQSEAETLREQLRTLGYENATVRRVQ